jgi:hypothetical protein
MLAMTCSLRTRIAAASAVFLLASSPMLSQSRSVAKQLAGTESIGDVVETEDHTGATPWTSGEVGAMAKSAGSAPPIHILYVHGINQVGAGDSLQLRKGICKYLGECTVTRLGRVYADGPFAVNAASPALEYMHDQIWKTQEDWNASAPFIDRYEIAGKSHTPILLDEVNWWPVAYPLKCKWLITRDATLTGASKELIDVCSMRSQRDPDHPGRYLAYQWILPPEAADLKRIPRHAAITNRSLKSGLMDWGFGDAVMALGPMEEILSAGIRELLMKSLESTGVNLQTAKGEDTGPQFFFVTHSLGSYLSLAALDRDLVGPQGPGVPQLKITSEEKNAADYLSAHTAGFYFLANQIELLELAGLSVSDQSEGNPCPHTPPGTSVQSGKPAAPASIAHWRCSRQLYLEQHVPAAPGPQIIAWSDPNDCFPGRFRTSRAFMWSTFGCGTRVARFRRSLSRLPVRTVITRATRTCSGLS